MKSFKATLWSAVVLPMLVGYSYCLAQTTRSTVASASEASTGTEEQEDFTDLGADYGTARTFPSLRPATFLKIAYFAFRQSTAQDKNNNEEELVFPARSTVQGHSSWIIIRKRKDDQKGTDIVDQVQQLDLQSIPGNAYFYFKPGAVRKGDSLLVGLRTKGKSSGIIRRKLHSTDFHTAQELEVQDEPSSYTLKLDPRTIADQELIDGTTKTVHQLGLNLDIPSFGSGRIGNLFFRTDDVISTAKKDKSAQIDLRLGIERSLLDSWYVPGNLEARYVANQAFTSSSFIVSGGFRTYIPWGFAHRFEPQVKKDLRDQQGNIITVARSSDDLEIVHRGLLWNSLVKSPLAPELSLNLQYENRIEQDSTTSTTHAAKNTGRVETLFELAPVYLLARGKPTPNDIVLTMRAKGWWFFKEESLPTASARKLEGNIEADVSIPLSRFKNNGLLSSTQSEEEIEKHLQISYRTGANEANSFIRSSEWRIGFNILR